MTKQSIAAIIFGILSVFGYRYDPAGLKYGNGVYTNICGSGTTARLHACSSFCDPVKGSCANNKGWVAKWTCEGKNTKCDENEKSGQEQSLSGTECNRTVALAVFDKNCRVGGWSCTEDNLKDYMVWYSGDCQAQQALQATITPLRPSVTPGSTSSPQVGATEGQAPSPTPTITLTPTLEPVAQKAPETGVDSRGMSLGLVAAIGVGWWIRRKAVWFWPD